MQSDEMPERIWAFEDYPGQGAVPRGGYWCDEQSECPEGSPEYVRKDLARADRTAPASRQEAVPACAACEDSPKHPNIPCAVCGTHPLITTNETIQESADTIAALSERVRVLEGALSDMVSVAEQDEWAMATTGRQLILKAALRALTPAQQPERQAALKISPEYQALFDEVKQRAQPEAATPTAQEAVPVGWITQPYPGVKWSFSFHAPKALPEGWIARPLFAHPPQPSETVAAVIEAANMARNRLEMIADAAWNGDGRDLKRSVAGVFSDFDAALRALKGGE